MNIEFHPTAEAEHLESIAYYESTQQGLGALYLAEFEAILNQVCSAPQIYPIEKKPNIRRVRLKRFPFTVLYRLKKESIQILAVAHNRRRPDYWLGRL